MVDQRKELEKKIADVTCTSKSNAENAVGILDKFVVVGFLMIIGILAVFAWQAIRW